LGLRGSGTSVPWQLHAVELVDGRWHCAHGLTLVDRHDKLPDAIAHLREVAKIVRPAGRGAIAPPSLDMPMFRRGCSRYAAVPVTPSMGSDPADARSV
jgi:hypothetical protein